MGPKSLNANSHCFSVFAAALTLLVGGCANENASMDSSDGYTGDLLSVNPPGPVDVGFSDTVKFDVTLTDERGNPVSGAQLDIKFIKQPHNAQVTPDHLITDAEGKGSVVFTAPTPTVNELVTFDIRFKSAEAETYVKVEVDPNRVKIAFTANYPGKRALSKLVADLYHIDETTGDRRPVGELEQDAVFPASFEFIGLLSDERYEVEVNALNNDNDKLVRATGSLSDLKPNTEGLTLSLEDKHLNITGNFASSWEITTDGALDWAVDRLVEAPAFIQNPSGAVMDGIEVVLSTGDPFAKETFITERAEKKLDAYLETHLQALGIDIQATFEAVGQAAKRSAERIRAEGTLEIGKTEDNFFIGYHAIDKLTFGLQNEAVGPEVGVNMLDRASCEISYGLDDTLNIGAHVLPLGLGNPIEQLFTHTCAEIIGYDDIAEVIKSIVDCAEIAAFLETSLSDVTVRSTIELGCISAIDTAKEDVHTAATAISKTNQLSFSDGSCTMSVPSADNQVSQLNGETFTLQWHAVNDDAALMTGAFTARIP